MIYVELREVEFEKACIFFLTIVVFCLSAKAVSVIDPRGLLERREDSLLTGSLSHTGLTGFSDMLMPAFIKLDHMTLGGLSYWNEWYESFTELLLTFAFRAYFSTKKEVIINPLPKADPLKGKVVQASGGRKASRIKLSGAKPYSRPSCHRPSCHRKESRYSTPALHSDRANGNSFRLQNGSGRMPEYQIKIQEMKAKLRRQDYRGVLILGIEIEQQYSIDSLRKDEKIALFTLEQQALDGIKESEEIKISLEPRVLLGRLVDNNHQQGNVEHLGVLEEFIKTVSKHKIPLRKGLRYKIYKRWDAFCSNVHRESKPVEESIICEIEKVSSLLHEKQYEDALQQASWVESMYGSFLFDGRWERLKFYKADAFRRVKCFGEARKELSSLSDTSHKLQLLAKIASDSGNWHDAFEMYADLLHRYSYEVATTVVEQWRVRFMVAAIHQDKHAVWQEQIIWLVGDDVWDGLSSEGGIPDITLPRLAIQALHQFAYHYSCHSEDRRELIEVIFDNLIALHPAKSNNGKYQLHSYPSYVSAIYSDYAHVLNIYRKDEKQLYILKSLYHKDLNPDNSLLIRLAWAAFHIKRYDEVRKWLGEHNERVGCNENSETLSFRLGISWYLYDNQSSLNLSDFRAFYQRQASETGGIGSIQRIYVSSLYDFASAVLRYIEDGNQSLHMDEWGRLMQDAIDAATEIMQAFQSDSRLLENAPKLHSLCQALTEKLYATYREGY